MKHIKQNINKVLLSMLALSMLLINSLVITHAEEANTDDKKYSAVLSEEKELVKDDEFDVVFSGEDDEEVKITLPEHIELVNSDLELNEQSFIIKDLKVNPRTIKFKATNSGSHYIKGQQVADDSQQFGLLVNVQEPLDEVETVLPTAPQEDDKGSADLIVQDGDVSIDIEDYNSGDKWNTGSKKTVTIKADYSDDTSEDKKLKVIVPEGVDFLTYPVLVPDVANHPAQTELPNDTKHFVTSVSSFPIYHKMTNTTSGVLEYELDPRTTTIEIKFDVDISLAHIYKDMSFTEAITAYAEKAGIVIGDAKAQIDVEANLTKNIWKQYGFDDDKKILKGDTDLLGYVAETINYSRPIYLKEIEAKLNYPKGAKYVKHNIPSVTVLETNDQEGYVRIKYEPETVMRTYFNEYSASKSNIYLDTSELDAGTYTTDDRKNEYIVTFFDGSQETITAPVSTEKINVFNESKNQLKHRVGGPRAFVDIDEEYVTKMFNVSLANDNISVLKDQWIEYTIDPNAEVSAVSMKQAGYGIPSHVVYKTNKYSAERVATNVNLNKSLYNNFYGISAAGEGLDNGEYFTYVRAFLGEFPKSYSTAGEVANGQEGFAVLGRLANGANEASLHLKTYSLDSNGDIEPLSINESTTKAVRSTATATHQLDHNMNASKSVKVEAGKTVQMKVNAFLYDGGNTTAVDSPIYYIVVPNGMSVSNIRFTNMHPKEIIEFKTTRYQSAISGMNIVKVETSALLGRSVDGTDIVQSPYQLHFDLTTNKASTQSIPYSDLVFIDLGQGHASVNPAQYSKDKYDVNNNGVTDENLLLGHIGPHYVNIVTKEELVVDSYIVFQEVLLHCRTRLITQKPQLVLLRILMVNIPLVLQIIKRM